MKRIPLITSAAFLSLFTLKTFAQTPPPYSWENLPKVERPVFKADTFNIADFGAKGDGVTLNTQAIAKAINTCNAKGGGVVLVPAGIWITGPVVLKSNVNLHINRSALLQFTPDKSQYQLVDGQYEGHRSVRNESPLSGTDVENIAITGEGIIDGHGEVWRAMGKDRVTEVIWKTMITTGVLSADGKTWYPSESYAKGAHTTDPGSFGNGKSLKDFQDMKDFFRPNLLVLTNCKRVLLQNTTFENSPAWCLHALLCENLTFDGVRVKNEENAQNGDGMDIESCSHVKVENCTLDCGDDGICIKSGKDEEGRKRGKASQYIIVKNNVVYKAHGGFVIGSEMSGGAHDIFVTDNTFIGTDNGLRFKTARGRGGIVENIFIRNTRMSNIGHDAILFDMYYFAKIPSLGGGKANIPPVDEGTPQFRKFYIENLTCDGADLGMLIRGLPEMSIQDIHISNVMIRARKAAEIVEAKNIWLKDVSFSCDYLKPLISVENGQALTFNHVRSAVTPELFFSISGDRSKAITVSGSAISEKQADFNFGADRSVLNITQ